MEVWNMSLLVFARILRSLRLCWSTLHGSVTKGAWLQSEMSSVILMLQFCHSVWHIYSLTLSHRCVASFFIWICSVGWVCGGIQNLDRMRPLFDSPRSLISTDQLFWRFLCGYSTIHFSTWLEQPGMEFFQSLSTILYLRVCRIPKIIIIKKTGHCQWGCALVAACIWMFSGVYINTRHNHQFQFDKWSCGTWRKVRNSRVSEIIEV